MDSEFPVGGIYIKNRKYSNYGYQNGKWNKNEISHRSLFCYNLILKHLPKWLKKEISHENLSICDWGCGQGEGVNLLSRYFKDCEVTGIDHSDYAIDEARKKYPNLPFTCTDITEFKEHHDVILSSQSLEHFECPHKILRNLIKLANKYLILMVPLKREGLGEDRFFFDYDFFPINIEDHQLIHFKEIDKIFMEDGNYWTPEQILVVFANKNNVDMEKLSLEELNDHYFTELKLAEKNFEADLLIEKIKNNELRKQNEKLSHQYQSEKAKWEELIKSNATLRSQLNNERIKVGELKKQNEQFLSQYISQKTIQENLVRTNQYLKDLINAYKKRNIVRLADKLILTYRNFKSRFTRNSDLPTTEPELNPEVKPEVKPEHEIKPEILHKHEPKKLKDIKVAVIMDEFSYNSFKYEFKAIPLEPSNWRQRLDQEKPDIFLCESAWNWNGKICTNVNSKTEDRGDLLDILKYCEEKGITTIFWNKEDPTHFDDELYNFVDTALKFDHIFTTTEECVKRYRDDYGHPSVHVLMFGAQPKLFNPIEDRKRSDDIVFAGSWYNEHEKRCNEMIDIFDKVLDSGYTLKIYDRAYYTARDDKKFAFPKEYSKFTNPPLPFNQVNKIYKESKYSLNINTVVDSNTMFARRVFELMLCNTLVLSNYSKGMTNLFGDNVIIVENDKELDLSDSEEKRINNLYSVLKNHTYHNRFKHILNSINFEYLDDDNSITLYYVVNEQSDIEEVLEHYAAVEYDTKKLVLLLSDQIPNHKIKNIYQKYSNYEVSVYSLNYLLNQGGTISNHTPYFVFANLKLIPDFVEKGLLHYSYIDKKVGIAWGDKFRLKKVENVENVLFSHENFMRVFNKAFKGTSIEFPVYSIQISGKEKFESKSTPVLTNPAKNIVIAYVFPPHADSSGNCMAKRVRKHGQVVDVIQNDMSDIRNVDEHLNILTEGLVEDKIVIDSGSTFENWDLICDFCSKGLKKLEENVEKKGEYEEIYSMVFLPASHFLAFEFKIKYPNTKWIAEFSDPVLYDEKGVLRYSKINDPEFINKVNTLLSEHNLPEYHDDNLLLLCEYLPYAFADEIVFTNENQKTHMMDYFPIPGISEIVEKKAKVRDHITLSKEFYYLFESDYLVDDNYVNIAYFGRDYETRNLNDIFYALDEIDDEYKNRCKIHIFTYNVRQFRKSIEHLPIADYLEINPYIRFLEFLNLTTKFDCLIVNDAQKKGRINPFLPSKLSDYMGSGTDIWGLYEENSTLSKIDLRYKSIIGDIESSKQILKQIIEDHS